jgi:tetratricopeptide (TPR) repeat protein
LAALAVAVIALPLGAQTPKLGHISFPVSGAAAARPKFIEGVLYLHSFEYDSAAKAFQEAQRRDPAMAMAYWGEAMTYNHPVWFQQDREKALAALSRLAPSTAARLARAKTERERRYLDAVEVLYGEGPKPLRDTLYSKAMGRLAAEYPDDVEAQAFYALSLLGTSHNGRDIPTYMRAAAICEEIFRDHPDHPGAAHYLIHSYDDPVHAPLGLRAARAYSKIAPAAAHAQHMTSHIFLALGMWDETVASNEIASRMTGMLSGHYAFWLLYAYVQQGRYAEARQVLAQMRGDAELNPTKAKRSHLAMARAAYLVDTHDWSSDVARMAVDTSGLPFGAFWLGLPDGWAAVERGDLATAESALDAMEARLNTVEQDTTYRLGSSRVSAEIMTAELKAMVLQASGKSDEAVALLSDAAAKEDAVPYDFGPPETIKPPKELHGELLLQLDRPAAARLAFERALARTPRRPAGLIGLARAAGQAGDEATAATALAELGKLWRGPPGSEPKVAGR